MDETKKFIANVRGIIGDAKNLTLACDNTYDVTKTYITDPSSGHDKVESSGNCFFMCELNTICLKGRPEVIIQEVE